MSHCAATYTNDCGDRWTFIYDPELQVGSLCGSDVDWQSYPVIEGEVLDLFLSSDESDWLRTAWNEATHQRPDAGVYGGKPTEFRYSNKGSFLTNDYCPICLRQASRFDHHHCIWASSGGSDTYVNLLEICRTCHAVISYGCAEDAIPRDFAALAHQIMHFGLEVFPREARVAKRHQGRDFLETYPYWKHVFEEYTLIDHGSRHEADKFVKNLGRKRYLYFREMAFGKHSWDEYLKRVRDE